MCWITKLKDTSVATIVRFWANRYRQQYGVMLDLKLDSEQKSVQAEILPKGETVAINVSAHYHLLSKPGGETLLTLSNINTSREWINNFLQAFNPQGVSIAVSRPGSHLLRFGL